MPVNSVSSNETPTYTRDTSNDQQNTKVDTETFLKLLVAQLKYQDPLEPQKDTAFVTQMAQMTSLQEMQSMNATLQNSQAYDMVGKEIYAESFDKDAGITNTYQGVVDSVAIIQGIPYVVLGTHAIPVSDVKQVFGPPASSSTSDTDQNKTPDPTPVDTGSDGSSA